MLIKIDKGFTNGEVVSLKLLNGDEIIARFEAETETEYKISKVLAITASASGLGMQPWIFLGEKDEIVLQKAHVFVVIPAKKDAAAQYLQSTTSIALR